MTEEQAIAVEEAPVRGTRDLLAVLAERHGLEREEVARAKRSLARRVPRPVTAEEWCEQAALLLIVHSLLHAADCGDPDCERCDSILLRLEERDLLRVTMAASELERLLEIERAAAAFLEALDDTTPERGQRAALAARRLREARGGTMAESQYTREERRKIAQLALGKSRREVTEIAQRYSVAPTTVYNWRRELLEEGGDVDGGGGEHVAKRHDEGAPKVEAMATRIRQLESTIADMAVEMLSERRRMRAR